MARPRQRHRGRRVSASAEHERARLLGVQEPSRAGFPHGSLFDRALRRSFAALCSIHVPSPAGGGYPRGTKTYFPAVPGRVLSLRQRRRGAALQPAADRCRLHQRTLTARSPASNRRHATSSMADIPFDKDFDLRPGRVEEVMPGVRRLLANNPSPFTFRGTVSYIVGRGQVALIDPGPLDEAHIAALLAAVRGETVTHIFVTHTHRDHSPAVPSIKAATGAAVYAEGPHRAARPLNAGEAPRMEAANDMDFRPDHAMADGEVVSGEGFALEGVTTPGHTANHIAFALKGTDI